MHFAETIGTIVAVFAGALLLTVPYAIWRWRKDGMLQIRSLFAFYSFVLYLLCAFLLVTLPLPADRNAIVPYAQTPQLVPFSFMDELTDGATYSLFDPGTWIAFVFDLDVYQIGSNILLTVPLGMYLRYSFKRSLGQTLLIGFLASLFIEISQLTGLWGWYAHPYRLFDVDDLILNTFGAFLGYVLVGPAVRKLPDVRLTDAQARQAGLHAPLTRSMISFCVDIALTAIFGFMLLVVVYPLVMNNALEIRALWSTAGSAMALGCVTASFVAFFAIIPIITRGQTIGQITCHLRMVRPDSSAAPWYSYGARSLPLFGMFVLLPAIIFCISTLDASSPNTYNAFIEIAIDNVALLYVAWIAIIVAWIPSVVVRAGRSTRRDVPFVMLGGLLSMTRVMAEEGIAAEREHQAAVDVEEIAALKQEAIASGTSLAELMRRAGCIVADIVCVWKPDPGPVTVFVGTGNNGGDGWTAGHALAESGYAVTIVTPVVADDIDTEPACSAACQLLSDAQRRKLPLRVLVLPGEEELDEALDESIVVIDALMGIEFSGECVPEPYASWMDAANRRRFEGTSKERRAPHAAFGRRCAALTLRLRSTIRRRPVLPDRAEDAPFVFAIDVPSGLSAQTGKAADHCFAADKTITMLANKTGLAARPVAPWIGRVHVERLVDASLDSLRPATKNAALDFEEARA